jgi:hypothetical protein
MVAIGQRTSLFQRPKRAFQFPALGDGRELADKRCVEGVICGARR